MTRHPPTTAIIIQLNMCSRRFVCSGIGFVGIIYSLRLFLPLPACHTHAVIFVSPQSAKFDARPVYSCRAFRQSLSNTKRTEEAHQLCFLTGIWLCQEVVKDGVLSFVGAHCMETEINVYSAIPLRLNIVCVCLDCVVNGK